MMVVQNSHRFENICDAVPKRGVSLLSIRLKRRQAESGIYLAASLSMDTKSVLGQTERLNELAGTTGIYVVSGSGLLYLLATFLF